LRRTPGKSQQYLSTPFATRQHKLACKDANYLDKESTSLFYHIKDIPCRPLNCNGKMIILGWELRTWDQWEWKACFHQRGLAGFSEQTGGRRIRQKGNLDRRLPPDSEQNRWQHTHIIQAPMSAQRFSAVVASAMQKKRILGVTSRYVIVLKQIGQGKYSRKNMGVGRR